MLEPAASPSPFYHPALRPESPKLSFVPAVWFYPLPSFPLVPQTSWLCQFLHHRPFPWLRWLPRCCISFLFILCLFYLPVSLPFPLLPILFLSFILSFFVRIWWCIPGYLELTHYLAQAGLPLPLEQRLWLQMCHHMAFLVPLLSQLHLFLLSSLWSHCPLVLLCIQSSCFIWWLMLAELLRQIVSSVQDLRSFSWACIRNQVYHITCYHFPGSSFDLLN